MEKQWRIYRGRLERFLSKDYYPEMNLMGHLIKRKWSDGIKIEQWSPPDDQPTPDFGAATSKHAEYTSTTVGARFGPAWTTHWFRVTLPKVTKAELKDVMLHWHSEAEGLLWSNDGIPLHGLSPQDRSDVPLELISRTGEAVAIYIEMACTGLFGNGANGLIQPPDINRMYTLERCELRKYNGEAVELLTLMQILQDMINTYGDGHVDGRRALFVANSIINTFQAHDLSTIKSCIELAKAFLYQASSNGPMSVMAIGNCHIDTAWLWRFAETRRKTARSWSSQLSIMQLHPKFIFAASQMQQFDWLKRDYPALFERITKVVEKGQFVPVGGSWVEMDGNLPCGEAFVRQFLYGQNFQKENFGAYSEIFWLPGIQK